MANGKLSNSTNPFFIFLQEFRENLKLSGSSKQKDVTAMAGEKWRQMSNDAKLTYVVWAEKNKQINLFANEAKNNKRARDRSNGRRATSRVKRQRKSTSSEI